MTQEVQLSSADAATLYERVQADKIRPFRTVHDSKCAELYYEFQGFKYRLIFTPDFDWFCDIAYVGEY